MAARLELHARKLYCIAGDCPRRVFAERRARHLARYVEAAEMRQRGAKLRGWPNA